MFAICRLWHNVTRSVSHFSRWRPGFETRAVYVEFVVRKVTVGVVPLRAFRLSSVSITAQLFHSHSCVTIQGMDNVHLSGSSSSHTQFVSHCAQTTNLIIIYTVNIFLFFFPFFQPALLMSVVSTAVRSCTSVASYIPSLYPQVTLK